MTDNVTIVKFVVAQNMLQNVPMTLAETKNNSLIYANGTATIVGTLTIVRWNNLNWFKTRALKKTHFRMYVSL